MNPCEEERVNLDFFGEKEERSPKLFLSNLNLQFFAEEETQEVQVVQEVQEQPKEEVKLLTPEEVGALIAKEKKKAQEKLAKELGIEDFSNAKEAIQKAKEWQDAQKTEAEKLAEAQKLAEEKAQSLATEKRVLEEQIAALKNNVKDEHLNDVLTLARVRVTEELTIDEAIKQVVEQYPIFAGTQQIDDKKEIVITNPSNNNPSSGNLNPFEAKLQQIRSKK